MSSAANSIFLAGTLLPPLQLVKAATSETQLLTDLSSVPEALLVGLQREGMTARESLACAFSLVETIQSCRKSGGGIPRYAIGFFPKTTNEDFAAVNAAMGSIIGYVTSHLLYEPISINLVAYSDTPLGHQRAADVAQALTSGFLDIVRGQTLCLGDD